MQHWQYYLLAALALTFPVLAVWSAVKKHRVRKERDFTRRLETLLLPKEVVKTVCKNRPGRWILTSQRLIIETGERFHAYPFKRIKKVSGVDETGKTTVAAGKMTVLTVKIDDRELTLRKKHDNFQDLVKGLKVGVAAAKKKMK